jgi:hypothetical protein
VSHAAVESTADRLVARWPAARPFVVVGGACVVAGGVVAAVTRPAGFELGSWLAAFLVLVGGVAQIALGGGQAWLAAQSPPSRRITLELAAWNVGAAMTIVGSLAAAPIVTTLGGIATVCALALFLATVGRHRSIAGSSTPWKLYVGLTAIVLVSTPVGLVLAWTRRG